MSDENQIFVHKNHNKQEIRNVSTEQLAAHPAGGDLYEGRIWSLNTDDRLYRYAGGTVTQIAEIADMNKFGIFVGVHDASTGIPTSGGSGVDSEGAPLAGTASIQSGDYWRVSVAGTIVGIEGNDNLSIGDLIISTVDGATAANEFLGVQKNLDDDALLNGSGTANYNTRWINPTTLDNSSSQDDGTTTSFGTSLDATKRIAVNSTEKHALYIDSATSVVGSSAVKINKTGSAVNSDAVDIYFNSTAVGGESTGINSVVVAPTAVHTIGGYFMANDASSVAIGVQGIGNYSSGQTIGGLFSSGGSGYLPSAAESTSYGAVVSTTGNGPNPGNSTGLKVFNHTSSNTYDSYGIIIDVGNLSAGNHWALWIKDGTQGAGKVLTSDVDGKAIWDDISSGNILHSSAAVTAANYTPTSILLCDTTTNTVTIDLPAAASSAGKKYTIKRTSAGTNNVVIDPNGAETIDGLSTATLFSQYDNVVVFCNGTEWFFIG